MLYRTLSFVSGQELIQNEQVGDFLKAAWIGKQSRTPASPDNQQFDVHLKYYFQACAGFIFLFR
jgi:hypothetical protein